MRTLNRLLTATAALIPAVALAHPGEHGGGFLHGLQHVVTQPDHLAMVCVLAALIGSGVWLRRTLRKRKAAAAHKTAQSPSQD